MYFSLSVSGWNRVSIFQAAKLTFTFPQPSTYTGLSQISLSAPPDWVMGRSRCPSLYLSLQTALSVIYLCDKRGPSLCWRRESLVLTELSAYICILEVHIHCCSCKEVTNYRLVIVPGTAQNCHCDKEWWILVERNSVFPFFSEILYVLYRYLHVFQSKLSRKSLVHSFHRPLNVPKLTIYCKFVRVDKIYGEKWAVATIYNLVRGKQKGKNVMVETNILDYASISSDD